jgi:3-oxoacyl-[acyl-carrier protein] reductase
MVNTSGWRAADRVAIVTGGSRGVGRETIRRLASVGYGVVVNYVHDQPQAEAIVQAVLEARGNAVTVRADVTDVLDVDRLFSQTIETYGAVDAVVHAVRGHIAPATLTELSLEEFDEMCRTSTRATLIVNRAAARMLRAGGAIVNLLTSVNASASPTYGGHAMSAAAVDALTCVLASELRDRDVTVNAVSLDVDDPCVPRSVAEVVTYLLGNDARGVTGQVIHLDTRGHTSGHHRCESGPALAR